MVVVGKSQLDDIPKEETQRESTATASAIERPKHSLYLFIITFGEYNESVCVGTRLVVVVVVHKSKSLLNWKWKKTHSGECIAGVGDEHTSFANSSIPNSYTLDESWCTHFRYNS